MSDNMDQVKNSNISQETVSPVDAQSSKSPIKLKKKSSLISIIGVVLFIGCIIFVFTNRSKFATSFGKNEQTKIIDSLFKAYETYDANTMVSLSSETLKYNLDKDGYKDLIEYKLNFAKETNDEDLGKNLKIKYEITDTKTISEDKVSDFFKQGGLNYSIPKNVKVTSAYYADLDLTVKGDKKEESCIGQVILIKENDKWLLLHAASNRHD